MADDESTPAARVNQSQWQQCIAATDPGWMNLRTGHQPSLAGRTISPAESPDLIPLTTPVGTMRGSYQTWLRMGISYEA